MVKTWTGLTDNLPNGKGRFVALKQPKIIGQNKPCFAILPIIEAIIGTFKKVIHNLQFGMTL